MTRRRTPTAGQAEAERYEIRVTGTLGPHWAGWFDGLTVRDAGDGTTVLVGSVTDQAALHGHLQRVRDLGLALVSVTRIEPGPDRSHSGPDSISTTTSGD
jgi:hypothetical protein